MNETNDQQFRSVAFGGFHKQDVLNYIETSTRDHAAKLEAVQKDLTEAEQAKETLEQRAAAAEEALAATEKALKDAKAELEAARADLDKKTGAITAAEKENADLKTRLKKTEPDAEAYLAVKDRTAGIELEAHHRAQDVLDAADAQAAKTRAEVEAWMQKLQSGYDSLHTDIDATISHVNDKLQQVSGTLSGISDEFARRDTDLDALLHSYRGATMRKAPQPLPLDGE
ncbi:MAG: hypothetical protein RR211_07700 [Pseudoflavonifractor sp.]